VERWWKIYDSWKCLVDRGGVYGSISKLDMLVCRSSERVLGMQRSQVPDGYSMDRDLNCTVCLCVIVCIDCVYRMILLYSV